MTRFGYFLSSEEYESASLIRQARLAEQAGFDALWISDHFHPWLDEQGHSSFVWSVIGALSQVTSLPIETAVTCPTIRIHPAIIAQAAATAGLLTDGRFTLGDGYICMGPQADLVKLYRDSGGGDRPVQGALKACWGPDAGEARATMRRLWSSDYMPGEAGQLPLPRHFEQLSDLVTEDMIAAPCGPDPASYVEAIRAYEDAGFDEVYLGQVGGNLEGAFEFFASQVLPRVREPQPA